MFSLNLLFDDNAAAPLSTTIVNKTFVELHCFTALRQQSLLDLACVASVELSVNWLSEEGMQALNLQYRDRNVPTNVLSFESELPVLEMNDGNTMLVLGDIVLCPSVIEREASEQGKLLREHWAHMLVHGTLHLCGYDHKDAGQAVDMESMEVEILARSGMADPYQVLLAR